MSKRTPTTAQSGTPARPGPRLLAGGNPQIPKGDGDAVVQSYIAAMPGWKHDVGRRLDEMITCELPGVCKAVRWNSPFYGVEGRGWFLAMHCMTRYVKVTWLLGASLEPRPPVASKLPGVRYVHLGEGGELDEAQIVAWVRQSAALPGAGWF